MTESDYVPTINAFIASKVEAGYQNLFLLKNRSGQWVYQVYSTATGLPETPEMFYLVYGKPSGDLNPRPTSMPAKGEVGTFDGLPVAGLEYDPQPSLQALTDSLHRAFQMLVQA